MRQFVLLLLCVCVLSACSDPEPKKPAYLLDETKMVEVMVDLHLLETASNLKLFNTDTTGPSYEQAVESMLLAHGVTKMAFDSSLFHYSTRTEQMNSIYDKVIERLYEMESQVNSDQ